MALIADRLPLIRTDRDNSRSIEYRRQRELTSRKMQLLAPIVEGQRGGNRLRCRRDPLRWLRLDRPLPMHLVTSHTGHSRLVPHRRANQVPRPRTIHWLHKFPDRAIEVHSMAPQAIVGKPPLRVVRSIGKY